MPATSETQANAARMAYAIKKGAVPKSKARGAVKSMLSMSTDELKKFSHTKGKD